jgi:branched-chain amino acid transport system substrate-binding protein
MAGITAPYYINQLKPKTMCMLSENEAYNISGRDMFKPYYEAAGITILADMIFDPGTTDFNSIISRLRAFDPDVLSIGPTPSRGILIVKQIYEMGWKVQIVSHGDLLSEDMFRVCGPATEGIMGLGGPGYWAYKKGLVPQKALDLMRVNLDWYYAVAENYRKTYGTGQERWAVEYYNIVNAFIYAMQRSGTVDDAVKMRDAMDGMEYDDCQYASSGPCCPSFQELLGSMCLS